MMRLAKIEGKLRDIPHFPMLKENPARKGFIEDAQFAKLLPALPSRLQPLILFLYFTGCRLGEAKKIQWSQVDLAAHQIHLESEQTKNSEPRILPLPEVLINLLKAEKRQHGSVFPVGNFRKAWISACVKARLGSKKKSKKNGGYGEYRGLIIHDLRRSAVRNLVRAGNTEDVAMKISGHKTRSIFSRYNIVSTADLHKAMNRLESARTIDVPALLAPKIDANLMKIGTAPDD